MTIGQIIKRERERQGLTQKQLSDIAQVSLATVKKWESKKNPTDPSGMPLLRTMRNLSIPVENFFN